VGLLSPPLVGEGAGEGLPDIVWCLVPAGPFLLGSDKQRDPQARDDELPQHTFTIRQDYYIARYPVTNAQFGAFADAGDGYRADRWWTPAGLQWRGDRAGPEQYGGAFDLPNHPVVMVSWYEAVAFCRWLTNRMQDAGCKIRVWRDGQIENRQSEIGNRVVRLPSEAEWERAARGTDGRIYPWGNEFDAARCNMGETGIGTTSAVGLFPGGASPYGVLDLSGNVWEWTASLWGPDVFNPAFKYPYNPADGREDQDAGNDVARVLRGGAFNYPSRLVRCSYRYRYDPTNRVRNLGFRVVLASPSASEL